MERQETSGCGTTKKYHFLNIGQTNIKNQKQKFQNHRSTVGSNSFFESFISNDGQKEATYVTSAMCQSTGKITLKFEQILHNINLPFSSYLLFRLLPFLSAVLSFLTFLILLQLSVLYIHPQRNFVSRCLPEKYTY